MTPSRVAHPLRRAFVGALLAAAAALGPAALAPAAAAPVSVAPVGVNAQGAAVDGVAAQGAAAHGLAAKGGARAGLAARAPERLREPVTNPENILSASQVSAITTRLEELSRATTFELYVVVTRNFSTMSGRDWANATADASGFGRTQVVLAVAADDRLFGIGAKDDSAVPTDAVAQIEDDVRDALRDDFNYVAAVDATANTLTAVEAGTFGEAAGGGTSSSSGMPLVVVLLLVGIGAIIIVSVVKSRKKTAVGGPGPRPGHQVPQLSLEELRKRAGTALVAADDAVKSSAEELAFAKAQFGLQATDQFTRAVDAARADVQKAFHIQQLLDDEIPEPDHVKGQMLTDILGLCERASATLTAQEAAFHELRGMRARLPEHLDELEQRSGEVRARVHTSRVALAELARRYPARALASISANPDQALELLDGAAESVTEARADVAKEDRATAVVRTRAAQLAVGQAASLLDAVDGAGAELEAAGPRLVSAIASISSDVTDAQRLAHSNPAIAPYVTRAQGAITQGRSAQSSGDPLAALRELTAAEAAIDEALAPLRAADEQIRRSSAMLVQVMGQADAMIRGVDDFISTRRGAVGPTARTRHAEAVRHLQGAHQLREIDPQRALAEAQRALDLARSARDIAQSDVNRDRGPGPGGGGMNNVGGMILGGIILDSLLRGGGGGGFGGGGFGGGGGFSGGGGGGFSGGGGGSF
ncbi:TPM domain-containing protein [Sanguibacter sp. A247]|uniref:TPM domain-containing protein n=1 Tax=unclassified Sanguibacter TaxID=2645534 RepID=UPI003FD759E2